VLHAVRQSVRMSAVVDQIFSKQESSRKFQFSGNIVLDNNNLGCNLSSKGQRSRSLGTTM